MKRTKALSLKWMPPSGSRLRHGRRNARSVAALLVRQAADTRQLLRAGNGKSAQRTERQAADSRLYGITSFARDILHVADNTHRALNALDVGLRERADASVKALLDGVELTERELLNALEKHGVKKLEPVGLKFDPNMHQPYEVPDSQCPGRGPGHQAGYMIGDRVLRPAGRYRQRPPRSRTPRQRQFRSGCLIMTTATGWITSVPV
jgi:molecular chaperone GrpE